MTQALLQTIWIVPFYGLIGALLTLPWSTGAIKRTGPRPGAYLNLFMTLLAFVHGSVAFIEVWGQAPQQLAWHWLQAADLDIALTIEISPISLGVMEVVTGISLLAQIYALGYMEKDWSLARFFGLMGFFEGALAGIALSDSLFLSYGLLEMLTLSTYLLVGFWYAQPLVVTAARDAFLTKRVGDIILFMGLVALSSYGAGLNFSELGAWAQSHPLGMTEATLLGLALIAGPTGKCAQFPLNLWLDEAMEGPNPAGILRNSVVVSAGAYVLIKLQPVFTLSPVVSDALIVIGTLTTLGASLMALAQIDIKRTLSHSTSAYLGLVFIAVGLGHVDIALILLFSHAIAKALLFMVVGSIIMTTSGQNITEMGGLWSRMPATTTAFITGSAGLVAVLPLGMFWVFQRWLGGAWEVSWWLLGVVMLFNLLSAVNLTRVFRLVFLGAPQPKTRRAPEVPWPMAVPMVTLSVITILAYTVPQRWQFWLSPIAPVAEQGVGMGEAGLIAVVVAGIVGCWIGFSLNLRRAWSRPSQVTLRFIQDLLAYDFYIEKLYNVTVVAAVGGFSRIADWVDRYVVDGAVNLVGLVTILSGQSLRYNVSGQFRFYVITILLGVGLILLVTVNLPV